MRIGVIFCIYGCEDYVDRCLAPWFNLSSEFDFIFTLTSGRFKDYADLDIPDRNKPTLKKLIEWEFDYMSITSGNKILDEDTSRNRCLEFLKPYQCDLIWLVDGDEFYTEQQIKDIVLYVKSTPEEEAYSIWLKNYALRNPLFINFLRPTLYRNRIYGGIDKFYFDSFFFYSDGIHEINDVTLHPIPKKIAFIEHNSWLPIEGSFDKIKYQKNRYCGSHGQVPIDARCSYEVSEDGKSLIFNRSFYSYYGEQIPILKEIGEMYSFDLELNFDRAENVLRIQNIELEGEFIFEILGLDLNYWGTYTLYLFPKVNYWINPSGNIHFDNEENFEGFKIRIFKNSILIHEELLYLKA